jgi:hypothetical protein
VTRDDLLHRDGEPAQQQGQQEVAQDPGLPVPEERVQLQEHEQDHAGEHGVPHALPVPGDEGVPHHEAEVDAQRRRDGARVDHLAHRPAGQVAVEVHGDAQVPRGLGPGVRARLVVVRRRLGGPRHAGVGGEQREAEHREDGGRQGQRVHGGDGQVGEVGAEEVGEQVRVGDHDQDAERRERGTAGERRQAPGRAHQRDGGGQQDHQRREVPEAVLADQVHHRAEEREDAEGGHDPGDAGPQRRHRPAGAAEAGGETRRDHQDRPQQAELQAAADVGHAGVDHGPVGTDEVCEPDQPQRGEGRGGRDAPRGRQREGQDRAEDRQQEQHQRRELLAVRPVLVHRQVLVQVSGLVFAYATIPALARPAAASHRAPGRRCRPASPTLPGTGDPSTCVPLAASRDR